MSRCSYTFYIMEKALSVNKVYEFFTEYTLYSYPRILRELLGFLFISAIFIGLLVQYLAIQDVIGHRRKWKIGQALRLL